MWLTINIRNGNHRQDGSLGHRANLVQLVFPKHSIGRLAGIRSDEAPPSTGLLTLATYAQKALPDLEIEVLDGNHASEEFIVSRLTAPIVGIGAWFSNYESALRIAKTVKSKTRETIIVLGGPHVSGLGGGPILRNNPFVDFAIRGDGEQPFVDLLRGVPPSSIPGLAYRDDREIVVNDPAPPTPLDSIPPLDLGSLITHYSWPGWTSGSPSALGFPISAVRGCPIVPRCDYCSIATEVVLQRSPAMFWKEILALRRQHGINFFFETGDIFPLSYASKLIAARDRLPEEDQKLLAGTSFRVYLRPGMVNARSAEVLRQLGVRTIFFGYESILCFHGEGQTYRGSFETRYPGHRFTRVYPRSFTTAASVNELRVLARVGIDVMAAFILGLPGESEDSLRANANLVAVIANEVNVTELLLNTPLPLPGSEYFKWCLGDPEIVRRYRREWDRDLTDSDQIDYFYLSRLFVDRFSFAGYDPAVAVMDELVATCASAIGQFSGRGRTDPSLVSSR